MKKEDKQALGALLVLGGVTYGIYHFGFKNSRPRGTESVTTTGVRGIRNNNVGNIRLSQDNWQGLRAIQTDPEFFQFDTMEYGIRAMMKLLQNYQRLHNLRTIEEKIYRWAPASDGNNPERYVERVVDFMNRELTTPEPITGDTEIPMNHEMLMIALARGMSAVEVYESNVPAYSFYERAWDML